MKEKKRKRSHNEAEEGPAKRVTLESSTGSIKVSFLSDINQWVPVLANSPGLCPPAGISFKPYTKLRHGAQNFSSEVLLHSAARSRIDYTVREQESSSTERLFNHYLGIYDPETQQLQLVEAREATIRGTPRMDTGNESLEEQENDTAPDPYAARRELALEFGNKQAQKRFKSMTENAISPGLSSSRSALGKSILDPSAVAVLDAMDASAPSALVQKEIKQAVEDAKPGPKPNLQAETVADVYPLEEVVGLDALRILTVRDWQDKVKDGQDILTKSRFVSLRLRKVVKSEQVRKIKALKYLLLLVEWYNCFKPVGGTKRLDFEEEFEVGDSKEIRDAIKERFADATYATELNKWHASNLHLHICALALIIDDFATDIYGLDEDLRLERRQIRALFSHLGGTVTPAPAAHLKKLSLTKIHSAEHSIARLTLPLKFPKPKYRKLKK